MKNIIVLGLSLFTLMACSFKQQYTQSSTEIESYKMLIQNYNTKNWKNFSEHYHDTAKVFFNSIKPLMVKDIPSFHEGNEAQFSSRLVLEEGQEYEMVVTNQGKTWVNFWGIWEGTLEVTGNKLKIPVHLTAQFVNGKIVEEHGYWDNAPVVLALQEIEVATKIHNYSE